MVDPSDFLVVDLVLRITSISDIHSDTLSFGRYIWNSCVSINHPKTVVASSGVPSPFSFLVPVVSVREIGSVAYVGWNIVCMASGATFCTFITKFFYI